MTDAKKVAAWYRRKAGLCAVTSPYGDKSPQAAELNAIADVVEAGDDLLYVGDHAGGWHDAHKRLEDALAKLAKAVGVEGKK